MGKASDTYWRRMGRFEQTFLCSLILTVALYFLHAPFAATFLAGTLTFVLGIICLVRLVRWAAGGAIWRLRNRLIAAYLFIAVVPILLIVGLAVWAGYWVIGQVAVYLVDANLTQRERAIFRQAEVLARFPAVDPNLTQRQRPGLPQGEGPPRFPAGDPERALSRTAALLSNSFPNFELLITGARELRYPENSTLSHPPKVWNQASGLILKNDGRAPRLYAWAHATRNETEVTILAPITGDFLAGLLPELGAVDVFLGPSSDFVPRATKPIQAPPAHSVLDFPISGFYHRQVLDWDSSGTLHDVWFLVHSRLSAVLGTVFLDATWAERIFDVISFVAGLFFLLELGSLIIGIRLSRSITGAVHELYEGTERIKEGDFTYRIPVRGRDQLAELSSSFNTMTENLGRLIIVAKEKERLESELAIAREVQNQLFPKNAPPSKALELKGVCNPARMVSGDYYDFMPLDEHALAFAIGDVAGKGISAALLMATIQSTMRTQLSAMTNGDASHLSTSLMVANLNRQLYATTAPEKYATFYFAVHDDVTNILTYTNAGHLAPILLRGGDIQTLESTGTVVGAFPIARYQEKKIPLQTGDLLVCYTDGIVEPENAYGEMFGEDRLKDLLVRFSNAGSEEIIARAMEAVNQWTGSSELQDDMTMVVARRL